MKTIAFTCCLCLCMTVHSIAAPVHVAQAASSALYLPLLMNQAAPGSSPSPNVFEENDTHVKLTGNWSQSNDEHASGGQFELSTTPDDSVQFQFTGDSVVLERGMNIDGGQATVSIDGQHVDSSLEFYFTEQRWQVPAIFDHLGAGPHTLTLSVSNQAHTASQGHAIRIDAFRVPSPFLENTYQHGQVARINDFRALAGIPLASGVQAINEAAQSHAAFVAAHRDDPRLKGLGAHGEYADLAGYTGQSSSDRARYFGYTGYVGEDIGANIDGLMATVYHRDGLICYDCVDVGTGLASDSHGTVNVINTGSRGGVHPTSRLLYTYPAPNQTDVPNSWNGGELPDPLPAITQTVGYPISLYLAQPASTNESSTQWKLTVAELRDAGGQLVSTYLLDRDSDPNKYLGNDTVFLIPQQPMALNASYTAHVAGTDSQGVAFDTTWSFHTQSGAEVSTTFITSVGACGAEVAWTTSYTSTGTIEYGADSTYGQQSVAQTTSAPSFFAGAQLHALANNTYYHYRIVTKDAQGITHASPDYVVKTGASHHYRVPEDGTLAKIADQSSFCDTIQVAPGTYTLASALPLGRDVTLLGSGADQTILKGSGTGSVVNVSGNSVLQDVTITGSGTGSVVNVSDNSVLQNATITGSGTNYWDAGISVTDWATPTIQRNRIFGNSMGIAVYCFNEQICAGRPLIKNNVIINNVQSGIATHHGTVTIVNNTIAANKNGIQFDAPDTVVRNNIVVSNNVVGIQGGDLPSTVSYNDTWNNVSNDKQLTPGPGELSVAPSFVAPAQGDYHLQPASPCVNAGDPDSTYIDRDGSRNDIGAYGGGY